MQITLRVPHNTTLDSEIVVFSADWDPVTSVAANAKALDTVPHEVVHSSATLCKHSLILMLPPLTIGPLNCY
jgi:hypothetical protein